MNIKTTEKDLLSDICKLIDEARKSVSGTVNKAITILYWKIGLRINSDLLVGKRAAYGSQIVSELATKLQQVYGRKGFELRNIRVSQRSNNKYFFCRSTHSPCNSVIPLRNSV